jgi:TusA-related sulfurtransferase
MLQDIDCKETDLRGQICPSTLLTALRVVNAAKAGLKAGLVKLVFLSDNRSSTTHIAETVGAMGYKVDIDKEQGFYHICIYRQPNL